MFLPMYGVFTLHSVASSVFARSCSEGVLKDAPCEAIVPPSEAISHKEIFSITILPKFYWISTVLLPRALCWIFQTNTSTRKLARHTTNDPVRISVIVASRVVIARCFAHLNQ